jgi:mono/diheme cytochrome c family protein
MRSMSGRLVPAALGLAALLAVGQPALGADAAQIARGKYLAIASDCTACHTVPGGAFMAGGYAVTTPIGPIFSTNITPSKTHGIGDYTLEQFSAALRDGVRADGKQLYPAMPYTAYALMPDADVADLYAYFMNAVPPVETSPTPTSLPFPFNIRLSMAAWNLLFLSHQRFASDPAQSESWNRGAYLVRGPAHCVTCHTPRNLLMAEDSGRELAGGDLGNWFAPNITSDANSGIGGWSNDELVTYLREGHAIGKSQAGGPMAEAVENSLQSLQPADLEAIATYLKTVPPVRDAGDTQPPFSWGKPGDDLASIRGVALPADRDKMSGPQLYDAYCSSCHQAEGQGSFDGGLPSLFHNTALGRANTSNLVMVMLQGLHRGDILMPGFASLLSDTQMATLGTYLITYFGNPAATVTASEVKTLRAGTSQSLLVPLAQIGIAVGVLVVLAIIAFIVLRFRRRPPPAAT